MSLHPACSAGSEWGQPGPSPRTATPAGWCGRAAAQMGRGPPHSSLRVVAGGCRLRPLGVPEAGVTGGGPPCACSWLRVTPGGWWCWTVHGVKVAQRLLPGVGGGLSSCVLLIQLPHTPSSHSQIALPGCTCRPACRNTIRSWRCSQGPCCVHASEAMSVWWR